MVRLALWISVGIIMCAFAAARETYVSALNICTDTETIGVRGSGQLYGKSHELLALKNSLPKAIEFTELDNVVPALQSEDPYAAIPVSEGGSVNEDGLRAVISQSKFGKYRKSVDSGKNLLKKYIEHNQSTNTCLALVGYSQGAQVIGETVQDMHSAYPASLKNVIYIGLLGDPQYSPSGFDKVLKPAWLRGNALYPFTGTLGARGPDYIPRNPTNPLHPFTKIGSWCNYGDIICATDATHFVTMRDGHASYIEEGIPEMVDEIRAAVANPDQNITGAIYPSSVCGAVKQDMVVLLDTSAYMRRNKDLFTNAKNSWDTKRIPGTTQLAQRTFGEQLLDSGCGDKRVAIVGFNGVQGQTPQLLIDFTSSARDIDTLMNSLYEPSSGGVVERPKIREAAILGMQQNWRPDASRTLLAVTPMAGAGPAPSSTRETWQSSATMNLHMGDAVGQQLLALSRQTRASIITAANLPIDMNGFTVPSDGPGSLNASTYLDGIARLTGGYNWSKVFVLYAPVGTVKNVDFSSSIQQFEKRRDSTRVTVQSVRAKLGQTVTLSLDDTANLLASAAVRGNGTATDWYLDCDAMQTQSLAPVIQQNGGKITFIPVKSGTCTAAVRVAVQANGNGCYFGCPEPFPPYMLKIIPFKIDIKPADYVDKVPADVSGLTKTLYDDRVELSWAAPSYSGTELVYLIKDQEGSVLAATTVTNATVTDTEKLDVNVLIQAVGEDGRSTDVSTSNDSTEVIDNRSKPVGSPSPFLEAVGSFVTDLIGVATNTSAVTTGSSNTTSESEAASQTGAEYTLGEKVDLAMEGKEMSPPASVLSDETPIVSKTDLDKWWWIFPVVLMSLVTYFGIKSAFRK